MILLIDDRMLLKFYLNLNSYLLMSMRIDSYTLSMCEGACSLINYTFFNYVLL